MSQQSGGGVEPSSDPVLQQQVEGLCPKWECDYCTYMNFPTAKQCTMCRMGRRLQRIEDAVYGGLPATPIDTQNDDDTSQENQSKWPQQQTTQQMSNVEPTKWDCLVCTYQNWPRSKRCTQCQTGKQQASAIQGATQPNCRNNESSGVLNREETPDSSRQADSSSPRGSLSPNQQQEASTSNRQPSVRPNVVRGGLARSTTLDSRMVAKKLQKWTCLCCTYENWPKNYKCVMCYFPRPGAPVEARSTGPLRNACSSGSPSSTSPPNLASPKSTTSCDQIAQHSQKSTVASSSSNKRVMYSVPPGGDTVGQSGGGSGGKSPKSAHSSGSSTENIAAATSSAHSASTSRKRTETMFEQQLRRLREQPQRHLDFLWLNAIHSIALSSTDCDPVEAYLAAGGEPARTLTAAEVHLLETSFPSSTSCSSSSAAGTRGGMPFEPGHSLLHMAVLYRRDDLLPLLIASATDPHSAPLSSGANKKEHCGTTSGAASSTMKKRSSERVKRVPSHASPETAGEIRRLVALSLRQRKGEFPCFYFSDVVTFALPAEIYDLGPSMQQRLFDEILDRSVQKELEEESAIINWSLEVTDVLGSRLYALWNRTSGDCLLDSVLQATWGVFDSENSLRQALADSLADAGNAFYPRWREYETYVAKALQYSFDDHQIDRDWQLILRLANRPGAALEQVHVFALAHVVRRPIIVYGVRVVKSYRGDDQLDYARFEGVYLPLLWESTFCQRSPICLGYTRGHFVALIPMEHNRLSGSMSHDLQHKYIHVPLQDSDGKLLPIHFLTHNEYGHEQFLLRTWLDVAVTDGGLWCCRIRLHRPPALVQQMVDDWLEYYKQLNEMASQLQHKQHGGNKKPQLMKQPHTSSFIIPPTTSITIKAGDRSITTAGKPTVSCSSTSVSANSFTASPPPSSSRKEKGTTDGVQKRSVKPTSSSSSNIDTTDGSTLLTVLTTTDTHPGEESSSEEESENDD